MRMTDRMHAVIWANLRMTALGTHRRDLIADLAKLLHSADAAMTLAMRFAVKFEFDAEEMRIITASDILHYFDPEDIEDALSRPFEPISPDDF